VERRGLGSPLGSLRAAGGKSGSMTALLVIGGVLGVGTLLVILGTIFKMQWGVNIVSQFECPRCHQTHGQIRTPRNLRQRQWGGFTCDRCGLEVDKWNRPLSK